MSERMLLRDCRELLIDISKTRKSLRGHEIFRRLDEALKVRTQRDVFSGDIKPHHPEPPTLHCPSCGEGLVEGEPLGFIYHKVCRSCSLAFPVERLLYDVELYDIMTGSFGTKFLDRVVLGRLRESMNRDAPRGSQREILPFEEVSDPTKEGALDGYSR